MKMNHSHRVLLTALLSLASASQIPAQSYLGGVRGIIQDPGGAAIADAKVTLINSATQVSRATVSNGQGEYVFSQIDPATYNITVETPGFKKLDKAGIIIATAQFLNVDLKVEVGDVSSSVSVNEEVPLIETANASND